MTWTQGFASMVGPTPDSVRRMLRDINRAQNSTQYSDMTILLNDGTKVPCHRVIMCARCDFFRGAMESGFKESTTGIVEMLDDPPEAVKALIDFIYSADYDIDEGQDYADTILSHLDVFIIGQKYAFEDLRDLARKEIAGLLWKRAAAATEAFPDVANAFEQLDIDNGCGWNINHDKGVYEYDGWLEWAYRHAHLFMADDDIWAAMLEKAPKLMEVLAQRYFDDWERSNDEWGMDFVQRLDGPGTSGEFQKCTVRCPRRECGHIQDRFFLTEAPMIVACNDCQSKYETRMWMEHVQNPADETNE